jgi:hypothetical protein
MAKGEVTVKLVFDPPVQRIEVLRLEPGDILAITVKDDYLTDKQMEGMVAQAKSGLPDGVRVMVLERAELSVIRPAPGVD